MVLSRTPYLWMLLTSALVALPAPLSGPQDQMGGKKGLYVIQAPEAAEPRPEGRPLTVYVASPLGFAESTRAFMRDSLIPAIKSAGATPINPWDKDPVLDKVIDDAKAEKDLTLRRRKWAEVVQKLGKKNADSIRRADGIVAVLEGSDVDSGTAAEVGYGTALGKWVIGYREDYRRTGEDETSEVNLQVEYFIASCGGSITHSLPDLQGELRRKARSAETPQRSH